MVSKKKSFVVSLTANESTKRKEFISTRESDRAQVPTRAGLKADQLHLLLAGLQIEGTRRAISFQAMLSQLLLLTGMHGLSKVIDEMNELNQRLDKAQQQLKIFGIGGAHLSRRNLLNVTVILENGTATHLPFWEGDDPHQAAVDYLGGSWDRLNYELIVQGMSNELERSEVSLCLMMCKNLQKAYNMLSHFAAL
jgi:hypothetical protein